MEHVLSELAVLIYTGHHTLVNAVHIDLRLLCRVKGSGRPVFPFARMH
jgi:hypothetical protein